MNDFSQMNIEDYAKILNKRKFWVIIPLVLFLIGGLVSVKILPKYYVANTLVLVESQKVPTSYVQTTVTSAVEERLKTIQEEVMSRSRLYEIIERFKLFPDLRDKLSIDQLIRKMRTQIKVQLRQGNAFGIYYEGKDPKVVAQVANAITEQFINANLKLREEQARETANFLEEMLRDQQEILLKRETALAEFLRQHPGELAEHTGRNLGLIEQLNNQMITNQETLRVAIGDKAALEQQIEALQSMEPEQMEDSTRGALIQQLRNLEHQQALLKLTYTESHPKVILMQNQIENLSALIYNSENTKFSVDSENARMAVDKQNLDELQKDLKLSVEKAKKLKEELFELQEKLTIQESLLESQEEKWADFLEIHPDIIPDPIAQNLRLIEQLNVQIMTKQVALSKEEKTEKSLESQITYSQGSGIENKGGNQGDKELRQKLVNLEKELTLLKASYSNSHPLVLSKEAEIENLKIAVNKSTYEKRAKDSKLNATNSIQNAKINELRKVLDQRIEEINKLKASQETIQEKIAICHARVDNAPNLEVEQKELTRQYDQERAQYNELLEKNLDAELARKLELRQKGEQFIRLDEAVPPKLPFKPNQKNILLISIVLGLGLGLGLAFLREFFDSTFTDSKDVERATKFSVLSSIPHITEIEDTKKFRILSLLRKKKPAKEQTIQQGSKSRSLSLEQNIPSSIQEFYRILKVKIEQRTKDENRKNTIMVTSTAPQEGKTTTATHLAWIMTQGLDKKVVLLDCDFYKPRVASYLDLKPSSGLCDYLEGKAKITDILTTLPNTKLSIISTGKVVDKSEELLESKRMKSLLERLREDFDFVILDIPSVMATVYEANILTPYVDNILFVIRAEKTARDLVLHSLNLLNQDKIMGIVLNDAAATKRATYERYVQYKQGEEVNTSKVQLLDTKESNSDDSLTMPMESSKEGNISLEANEKKSPDMSESQSVNFDSNSIQSPMGGKNGKGNVFVEQKITSAVAGEQIKETTDPSQKTRTSSFSSGNQVATESSFSDPELLVRKQNPGEDPLKARIRKYLVSKDTPPIANNGEPQSTQNLNSYGSSSSHSQNNQKTTTLQENFDLESKSKGFSSNKTPNTGLGQNSAKTYMRMILDNKEGIPYANKDYKLVVDGKAYFGRTNSKGLVDEEIPANSQKGELSLRINENDPNEVLIWPLNISNKS